MLSLIAQASLNENNTDLNGLAGDQIGHEINAIQWYDYPWICVYRAKTEEHREMIARFMEKAVTNGYIGYDTNMFKRETLFESVVVNGYKPEIINTPVYCDCSALVFCAVHQVVGADFVPTTDNNTIKCPRVKDYFNYIDVEHPEYFDKLTATEYLTSSANLLRGDILVYQSGSTGHMGVWI